MRLTVEPCCGCHGLRRVVVLLLASLLAGWGSVATAATVEDVVVELEGDRVLLSFRLDQAFDDEVVRRVESGLATGYTFQLQLMRDRLRWADKRIGSSRLQVVALYNAISREYLINLKHDGDLIESRVVRDRDELRRAMTEIVRLPVFSVAGLTGHKRALVRVRAELGTRQLLFIIPFTQTTGWRESAKFHLPAAVR